jgi:GxxExxY protein
MDIPSSGYSTQRRHDAKTQRGKIFERKKKVNENQISNVVIGCAIEVHKTLGGPGLLESVYEEALAWELEQKGLTVKRQLELPIRYKGILLSSPLRLDVLIEDKVIVECKAVREYNDIFEVQALTYLRMTDLRLGLVMNFGERVLKLGVHRVVNNLKES